MDKITVGRTVNFVTYGHYKKISIRPMIVVHVWDDITVNGVVFFDGINDPWGGATSRWETSVMHKEPTGEIDESLLNTWHWPQLSPSQRGSDEHLSPSQRGSDEHLSPSQRGGAGGGG